MKKSMALLAFYAVLYCGTLVSTTEASAIVEVDIRSFDPPPHNKIALMARYILHNCNWLSIATISTQDTVQGFPFVSLKSLSDGPMDNSTGVPYLYMTDMDVSGKDVLKNNNVTIMATLAQSSYCEKNDIDPQDPRCAKVIISGKLNKVNKSNPEFKFGQESLFERHPAMRDWPVGHEFYVAKIDIIQILVLDFYGGIKTVSIEDYFNANITKLINLDSELRQIPIVAVKSNF